MLVTLLLVSSVSDLILGRHRREVRVIVAGEKDRRKITHARTVLVQVFEVNVLSRVGRDSSSTVTVVTGVGSRPNIL